MATARKSPRTRKVGVGLGTSGTRTFCVCMLSETISGALAKPRHFSFSSSPSSRLHYSAQDGGVLGRPWVSNSIAFLFSINVLPFPFSNSCTGTGGYGTAGGMPAIENLDLKKATTLSASLDAIYSIKSKCLAQMSSLSLLPHQVVT